MSDPVVPYTPTDEDVRDWIAAGMMVAGLSSTGSIPTVTEAQQAASDYLAARDARVRAEQQEADAKIAEQDHVGALSRARFAPGIVVDAPVFYGPNEAAAWAVGHAAGWDAAVAARPEPDREVILRALVEASRGAMSDYEWSLAQLEPLTAYQIYADAIVALLTTDTTKDD